MTEIIASMTTGLTDAVESIMTLIATVLPIGLGVFAVKIAIDAGKKFFSKVTN